MDFDQYAHAKRPGRRFEVEHPGEIERGGDEQYAVGTHGARLVYLIGVDDKILAKHGELAGAPRGDKVVGAALKELPVGEYREAGRAVSRVGAGDVGGIE